jgi:hypothetical protein
MGGKSGGGMVGLIAAIPICCREYRDWDQKYPAPYSTACCLLVAFF